MENSPGTQFDAHEYIKDTELQWRGHERSGSHVLL